MATDPRFDPTGGEMMAEEPRRSRFSTCLSGCLLVLGIVLLLGVIAGFWIWNNWRDWVADFASQAIEQGIDAWDLPAQEKQEVQAQVDRVIGAFRDERLSAEQLATIMSKLVDSPLMTTMVAVAVDKMYLEKSGLSDEEKAAGRQDLKRFVRGVVDDKIDQQATDEVMVHIADHHGDQWQLREHVSDADLRAFLAAAKDQADKAEIPAEPEEIDPSDEIKRIVDEAMGEAIGEQEAEPPAETEPQAERPAANSGHMFPEQNWITVGQERLQFA